MVGDKGSIRQGAIQIPTAKCAGYVTPEGTNTIDPRSKLRYLVAVTD
jgi:hypothetical protein